MQLQVTVGAENNTLRDLFQDSFDGPSSMNKLRDCVLFGRSFEMMELESGKMILTTRLALQFSLERLKPGFSLKPTPRVVFSNLLLIAVIPLSPSFSLFVFICVHESKSIALPIELCPNTSVDFFSLDETSEVLAVLDGSDKFQNMRLLFF